LKWEGREYQLPVTDGRGNAIHGLVLNRPWRVVEQADHQVTGEFQASRDDPSVLQLWPADFEIRVTYSLRDNRLTCQIHVENPDTKPLPCGLGTHPYFRVPLGGPRADDCVVQLPITQQWELENLLPTGRRLPVPDASKFQQGQKFGELKLDNVFTGLVLAGHRCKSTIVDPGSGTQIVQTFDRVFRECVAFTPPHREAICIEPYTCVPGCFELAARGIDAGVRMVPPGGGFTAGVEIEVGV
jgi:aldose 1-epimerase